MITHSKNPTYKPRSTRHFSDLDILFGFLHSEVWKLLLFRTDIALGKAFLQYLAWIRAVLAFQMTAITRHSFGARSIGLVLGMFSLLYLLVFNSVYIYPALSLFAVLGLPALPFIIPFSEEAFLRYVIVEIRSPYLLYYSGLFTACWLIHLFRVYFGYSPADKGRRGESYLYTLLTLLIKWVRRRRRARSARPFELNSFFIHAIVEPGLWASAGAAFYIYLHDPVMPWIMWSSALAEGYQQISDQAHAQQKAGIIEA